MEDLSLHILDVVENATAAGATLVEITIRKDSKKDLLEIRIEDNGHGMDPETAQTIRDPFVTTRTTRRVGLGIPLLEQSAEEADGELRIESAPGQGTKITATFRAGHIERKPLGDISSTLITLILGNPEIDFRYESDFDGRATSLDTGEIREQLDGLPLSDPAVLGLIRGLLEEEKE